MTQNRFCEFMMELATLVPEPFVLLFDNATCHRQLPELNDGQFMRPLPPSSPLLNMTERAISSVKAVLKRRLAVPEEQRRLGDRQLAAELNIPLQEHRLRILQEHAELSIPLQEHRLRIL
jgi:hypothetical protein